MAGSRFQPGILSETRSPYIYINYVCLCSSIRPSPVYAGILRSVNESISSRPIRSDEKKNWNPTPSTSARLCRASSIYQAGRSSNSWYTVRLQAVIDATFLILDICRISRCHNFNNLKNVNMIVNAQRSGSVDQDRLIWIHSI